METAWICAKSYGIVTRQEKQYDAADEYWRQQKRDLGTNGRQQIQTTPRTASAPNEGSQSCEQLKKAIISPKKNRKNKPSLIQELQHTRRAPKISGANRANDLGGVLRTRKIHCSSSVARKLPLSSHCPQEFRINYHIGILVYVDKF